jgi:hypothetical protein
MLPLRSIFHNRIVYDDRRHDGEVRVKRLTEFLRALTGGLVVIAAPVAGFAQAPPNIFSRADYEVRSGDVNGDGRIDILARARQKFAMIALDDLMIPIPIRSPVSTFAIMSDSSGNYSLTTDVSAALLANPAWRPGTHDLRYGDILGNGAGGAIIEARNAGDPSFSVNATPGGIPRLLQTLNGSSIGFDLAAAGTTSSLSDRNGDGRTDLTIERNGFIASVLHADSNGLFSYSAEGTVRAVWLGFKGFLDAGNTASALGYIAADSAPMYTDILQQLGTHVREIGASWGDIRLISMSEKFASFSIADTAESRRTIHVLVFIRENGRWYVSTL